ncbi:unnamed protein product [Callosobruchus maculatus]|uniref:APCDD1 domain-containing protein n=1 Tax=Callosobruchus maculatus TaxID=64391 RepID=A0A653CI95_CALMS|nr:unnamed protein product [Callosobruchus maculatus]
MQLYLEGRCRRTVVVVLLLVISFGKRALGEATKCEKLAFLAAIEDHRTVVETSHKLLTGTWVSEGCEVRPGPQFVLRSYTFDSDGRFMLIQHHYWDNSCSSPQLSIICNGRIQLRTSLVQPGAASGLIRISNITIIPQDKNAANELERVSKIECPGQYSKAWRQYAEHTVYDSRYDEKKKTFNLWTSAYDQSLNSRGNNVHSSDISCLGALKWAFNELKLLKVQLRPIIQDPKKKSKLMKMELLLGDIHSNYRLREYHMPTSFQVPLVKQIKEETTVFVNRHGYTITNTNTVPVMNTFTDSKTPPHLLEKPPLPPYIWGEWTSTRCEVRPMGLYLTRRFSFYSEDKTWIGDHEFYSDPYCKIPKFTVTAAGHYSLKGPSKSIKGASNIDFHIEKATLTVLDQKMIYNMRLPGLCGQGTWQVGVAQDLSVTKGCPQLGIILPSVQYDIIKIEMDYKGQCLLFLGQVETDTLHSSTDQRPSAFQLPLVKCGEVAGYSQSLRDILDNDLYYSSASGWKFHPYLYILIVTLVLIW